jgi:hypothetical protein
MLLEPRAPRHGSPHGDRKRKARGNDDDEPAERGDAQDDADDRSHRWSEARDELTAHPHVLSIGSPT